VKRKGNYHLNVPPPPPAPHPHQITIVDTSQPYQFENVQQHNEEQPSQQVTYFEKDFPIVHSSGGGSSFYIDNGLRNIAKGSADQANSAVASQNAAGKQAAYVAKSTLAQAAAQAASTAVAVLKGKEVLLHRLEEQNSETHKIMESELTQLQQAKRAAKSAQYAAQQAINHVSVLTAALNNAQAASELAQKAASEAAAELASQIDMVAQAKTKLEQVESHLYSARLDYEETKEAAAKATQSAQEAQINANDAAVHANVELSESVHIQENHNEQITPINHNF
ncbi:uncharacterized protein LOC119683921, partial [Teleopsis dalmanni]|uniref:uncharacterized protein LOC119680026 n=1 Tax=Teleopsis dalmanni TaxID=139649 RepID=UPI0018CFBA27